MGQGREPCHIDNCAKTVRGWGLCVTHYNRWREWEDPYYNSDKDTTPRGRCHVDLPEQCERSLYARNRGLCSMHYNRWREWEDPYFASVVKEPGGTCHAGDGCAEPIHAHGLCQRHAGALARWEDPYYFPTRGVLHDERCHMDDCDKRCHVLHTGLCSMHYRRFIEWEDPYFAGPSSDREPEVCHIDGCNRSDRVSLGLCSKHYQRWIDWEDPYYISIVRRGDGVAGNRHRARQRARDKRLAELIRRGPLWEDPRFKPPKPCALGCGRPAAYLGLCDTHGQRFRKTSARYGYGDPFWTEFKRRTA